MTINKMCVNSVSGGNNCKRDNGNYNKVADKAIDRHNRIDNCEKTFDEMLASAQEAMRVDINTPKFDAMGDVLEDILALKDLDVEARLSSIESRQSNKELETILGVSKDYYRDRYFALLKLIALCEDIK